MWDSCVRVLKCCFCASTFCYAHFHTETKGLRERLLFFVWCSLGLSENVSHIIKRNMLPFVPLEKLCFIGILTLCGKYVTGNNGCFKRSEVCKLIARIFLAFVKLIYSPAVHLYLPKIWSLKSWYDGKQTKWGLERINVMLGALLCCQSYLKFWISHLESGQFLELPSNRGIKIVSGG